MTAPVHRIPRPLRRVRRRASGRPGRVARVAASVLGAGVALLAVPALALPAAAADADAKVSVDDNFFKPKRLTVVVGDKVTWKWNGFVAHNVVVEKGPQKFESKTQTEGKFTRRIKKPGVYRIVCTLHPGMEMKLTAVDAPPVTTASTTPPSTAAGA